MQRYRRNRDTDGTHDTHEKLPLSACVKTLTEAARIALDSPGHGDPVFKFARAVKAFETTTRCPLPKPELPAAFNVWWTTAKADLPEDAEYDEYLFLFLQAYERVKTPMGANVFDAALNRVRSTPPPPEASRYTSPKLVRLVHLCRELQTLAGDSPFFLGIRDAARLIDCPRNETAAAFLNGLVRDGILTLISKGTPGGRRASRYRFNSAIAQDAPT